MKVFHFKTRLHCVVSLMRLSFFTLAFMVSAGCAESGGGTKAPVEVGGGDNSSSDNGSNSSDGSGNNTGDNDTNNDATNDNDNDNDTSNGNDNSNDQNDSGSNNTDGYGYHDGSDTYTTTARSEPLPVVDSEFFVPPTRFGVTKNLVTDFAAGNTDTMDDTAQLQSALDELSAEVDGGKLIIPAGDYYFRAVTMRSNVHIEVAEDVRFHMASGGGYNVSMFEFGLDGKSVENFSLVGLAEGFVIDLTEAPNERSAVFRMGYMSNFKFSNFTIEDGKTIFASFLVGVAEANDDLVWPVGGIIEKVEQKNSLFGYGIIQTYAADKILFRDLHSHGGIALRMETDHLSMKEHKKGGIRDIYAQNITCTDGLTAVMFGPHFQQNGSVQVDGVTSNGCGFAVRVDSGYVELFSPKGVEHSQESWRSAVEQEIGPGCAAQPYARGVNQFAARINHVNDCLDVVHDKYGLKPGWFEESYVYNVTVNYGKNAHLKQNQLDYFDLNNQSCADVCLPTKEQWSKQGQIYLGPSLGGVIDYNKAGVDYDFNVNVSGLNMVGFPEPHHSKIDADTTSTKVCNYYGMEACPIERWQPQD